MSQLGFPTEVTAKEIAREKSLGGSIGLAIKAAGLEPKQAMDAIRIDGKPVDKAQWSRWESGAEGVMWPKLVALMDVCGNDAPLLWMLHDRGYDLSSLRRRETELEKQLREAQEEIQRLNVDSGNKLSHIPNQK